MSWPVVKRALLAMVAVVLVIGVYIGRPRDVTVTTIEYSMDERVPSEIADGLGTELLKATRTNFEPLRHGGGGYPHSHVVSCGEGCSAEGFVAVDGVASRQRANELLAQAQRAAGAPLVRVDHVDTRTERLWWCPKC